ncbi:12450_t:CDS:2 [Ambispora gerdemannii]|uniref:12450_t:CDS:1 n=1 Tax=Ambispora gerdemannii TaxID=144530 RepID=A0A9N9B7A2_9GLOM|nr:12450_t:CDS:2 [Ambispora gerdemannii]
MRSFLFSLYSSKELAQVSEETKDEDASFPQYPNEHKVPQNKLAYKGIKYQESIQGAAFKYFVETSAFSRHLVILYELVDALRQSHEVQQNGVLISDRLNGLVDGINVVEEDISDFRYKASEAFNTLQSEMSLIYDALEAEKLSDDEKLYTYDIFIPELFVDKFYEIFAYWDNDRNLSGFIKRQLKFLEFIIRDFKGHLNKMIDSLSRVKLDARNMLFYLIDGEREAEKAVRNYRVKAFIDYGKLTGAENELSQVRQVKKFTKSLVANLNEFDHYLRDYKRKLLDVETDVIYARALKKPSKVLLNYLKTSANQFQKKHRLFDNLEKKIGTSQSSTLEHEEIYKMNDNDTKSQTLTLQPENNESLSQYPISY